MGLELGTGVGQLIPLLIYMAAIGAAISAIVWGPQYGLYFLIPMLPLQTTRYRLHPYFLGDNLVDIILLCVGIGILIRARGGVIPKSPMNKILAFFAIFLYVSLSRGSSYLGQSMLISVTDPRFSNWKDYMILPLLCILTMAALKDVKHIKILLVLMIGSMVLVNVSFFNVVSSRDLSHYSDQIRDAGTLGYAGENGFSAFEAQCSMLLIALFAFDKRKAVRLALLPIILFTCYCLLFSFSRGAYAAFLAGIIFLGLFRQRKLLVAALVILIGWQVLLPTAVKERISMTVEKDQGEVTLDASAAERVAIWQDALNLSSRELIFGTGFDTYEFLHRVGEFGDTHNYYLKVLVETGIVGLLIFLWMLVKAFIAGFRLYREADDPFLKFLGLGFATMLVSVMVANLFGDRWTYLQVSAFLWAFLGCTLRGLLLVKEQKSAAAAALAPAPLLAAPEGRVSPA